MVTIFSFDHITGENRELRGNSDTVELSCETTSGIRKSDRDFSWFLTRILPRKRPHGKVWSVVADENFRNLLIIHKHKTEEIIV